MSFSSEQEQRKRVEMAALVRESPCPSEIEVRQWLDDADFTVLHFVCLPIVGIGALPPLRHLRMSRQDLQKNKANIGLREAAKSCFVHEAFQRLYEAPLAGTPEESEKQKQEAFAWLREHGGDACKGLHEYLLDRAIREGKRAIRVQGPKISFDAVTLAGESRTVTCCKFVGTMGLPNILCQHFDRDWTETKCHVFQADGQPLCGDWPLVTMTDGALLTVVFEDRLS